MLVVKFLHVTFLNALHHDLLMSTLPRQDKEIVQVESPGFAFKSEAKVGKFIQSSE